LSKKAHGDIHIIKAVKKSALAQHKKMIIMKYFNLFIVITLFLGSCTRNANNQDNILIIDFGQEQNADVSPILERDFVKLETGENCLVNNNIRQIASLDGKIFVLSGGESSSLHVFDLSGKFITSIGKMGNAPGEYLVVTSFSFDRRKNIISLVDAAQKKIINYNARNYEFVSEYKTSDHGNFRTCWKQVKSITVSESLTVMLQ
jgi:hypothetical protein